MIAGKKHNGFTLLEFAVFVAVMAIVYWAIAPRAEDGMKLAHEHTVSYTVSAFRTSLHWLQNRHQAKAVNTAEFDVSGLTQTHEPGQLDLNAQGWPLGTSVAADRPYQTSAEHCREIWYGLLGAQAPSAELFGPSTFRITLSYDRAHGLGCHYQYRLAGSMYIDYFPSSGQLRADSVFD